MSKTFLSKKFLSLLVSGTVYMIVVPILLLSDSVIAGLVLGETSVAGISLVTPAYSLAAFFGGILSIGVPILYNRAMGEFDQAKATQYFRVGLTAAVSIGVLLFLAFTLLGDTYLHFFEATPTVFEQAKQYFFWYKLTILILPLFLLMCEAVFSDGDDTISTIAGIVQLVVNIALSIVLAKSMGIEGIALGSFIGTALALLVTSLHLFKKGNSLKIGFHFSIAKIFHIAKYSTIDASTYLFFACFAVIVEKYITFAFGSEMLIIASVIFFAKEFQIIFDGIGEAITPLINIYLGEESYRGIKNCYKLAQKAAIVEGVLMTIIIAAAAPLIVKIYGIENPEIAKDAINGARIIALGLTGTSLLYLLSSYYLLIDKIFLGALLCGLRDVIVAAPFLFILGEKFGIYGFFIGIALSSIFAYIVSTLFIRTKYGKENYPLLLADKEKRLNYRFYELKLEPELIIDVQKQIERYLQENGINKKIIAKVKLLIEELFMLVFEKNGNAATYAECSVFIREDGIQIITKDDGVLFDLSSDDVIAGSITEFMVSGYMEKMKNNKMYLTTMSYNRNTFKVKFEA